MERRKFVIGLGALATGSAAAMGTGAFTSATTPRDATIQVAANDSEGYIGLTPLEGPNDVHVEETGHSGANGISIDISDTEYGEGVNEDATFLFDNLFTIRNQGSQSAWFWTETDEVTPYAMDGKGTGGVGDRRSIVEGGTSDSGPYDLGPRGKVFKLDSGESIDVGLEVSTYGTASDSPLGEDSIGIVATADTDQLPDSGGIDIENDPS